MKIEAYDIDKDWYTHKLSVEPGFKTRIYIKKNIQTDEVK
jgi:hypothetical protein